MDTSNIERNLPDRQLVFSEITVLEPLTVEEESERLRLERKVERAFYEAGKALSTLRARKLYRSTHKTFHDYCKERFGFTKRSAYYLIDSVAIVDNLSKSELIVHFMPTSETQCRPLKSLKPEQQRQAWTKAVEKAGGVPTAKIVKEVVNQIRPKEPKAKKTKVEQNQHRTQSKIEYVPLVKAELGQSVRVKSTHALFPLQQGQIVQLPNNRSVIVMLEDSTRELISIKDLEMQRIVEGFGQVKTPVEGPNRIPGAGLDWYVRLDEETFKALDSFAKEAGIPTLGLAVKRLLEQVEK